MNYFKWISGKKIGQVFERIAIDEEGVFWTADGEQIDKSQQIYITEISSEEYNSKKTDYVPPIPLYPKIPLTPTPQQVPVEQDPIRIILDKQKNTKKYHIQVELDLELPNEKVLEFLEMMFEADDLKKSLFEKYGTQIDLVKIFGQIIDKIK